MPVQFTAPVALLLLPLLVPFLWWGHHRSVTDMSPPRKRLALAMRLILVALIVLALAGTRLIHRGNALSVVFLADGSRSVREDQRARIARYIQEAGRGMRPGDRASVVTFARDPHTQSSLGSPLDPSHLSDPGSTTSTDIAQALRQARNELDTAGTDSARRIVLLSDGNENAGRAIAEVPELAAAHITLDTVTLPSSLQKEALIEKVVLPTRANIGQPFLVRVVVNSLTPQTARVMLSRDGRPIAAVQSADLHAGKNIVQFEQSIDRSGFFRYSATLDVPEDTIPENNRGEGSVWVRGRPTVLYVSDDSSLTGFLRRALKDQNIDVEHVGPGGMPTSAAALQRFDSVFLSNVRASDLSLSQMSALQTACRDFGIGFGMVGGDSSFGAGGYRGTPIEEALPVTMDVKKQKRLPSVAVALVIEDLEIPSTVNMSIEAAKATMDLLEPIDQVGVLDCNGPGGYGSWSAAPAGNWRIPMQHVTDRNQLKIAMQKLTEMGDPPSYTPFLMEAARVLNSTDAKVKHILFLGDGDAVFEGRNGETESAVKRLRSMGITLSTITTGANGQQDVRFMSTLAFLGGGHAYVADRPEDLPRLLLKDQQTISQPPIIEEPFQVSSIAGEEIFKGIDWRGAPPLLGYNVSSLKATADLSLVSHRNDPIFAGWRYGLGRSVAFLSDDRARWAAQWLGWQGYSKFWAQAIRWTLRPFSPGEYSTQIVLDRNRGHLVVDAVDPDGKFVNKLQIRARIASPGMGGPSAPPSREEPVPQTGPGRYECWFDVAQTGTYLVNVLQKRPDGNGEKATVVGLSVPYSLEYRDTQPNRYLMGQMAQAGSGRSDPPSAGIFGGERPPAWTPRDITTTLLLLAILLLPFDIAVRRLAIERGDFQRAAAWMRTHRLRAAAGRAATPELSRLLDRKEAVVADRESALTRGLDSDVPGAVEPQLFRRASEPPGPPAGHPPGPIRPAVESTPDPPPVAPAEDATGMSRLMAAKRRAMKQQEEESRGSTGGPD